MSECELAWGMRLKKEVERERETGRGRENHWARLLYWNECISSGVLMMSVMIKSKSNRGTEREGAGEDV